VAEQYPAVSKTLLVQYVTQFMLQAVPFAGKGETTQQQLLGCKQLLIDIAKHSLQASANFYVWVQ
jgi:hypothetical protein